MWYHYLAILVGIYMVASALYTIIKSRGTVSYVFNGIYIAIGGYIAWWAYSALTAPPPLIMMGGRRRWW
jgi:hypothetical protein